MILTIYSILMIGSAVLLAAFAMTDCSIYLYLTFAIVFMLAVCNIVIEVVGV